MIPTGLVGSTVQLWESTSVARATEESHWPGLGLVLTLEPGSEVSPTWTTYPTDTPGDTTKRGIDTRKAKLANASQPPAPPGTLQGGPYSY